MKRLALPGLTLGLLAAFAAGPVVWLVARSLASVGGDAFAELATPAGRTAVLNTLKASGGAATFALALGLPLSLLLYRTDVPFRRGFTLLLTLPSAIPPFIWALGWVALASPKVGYLGPLVPFDIYSTTGMAFVLGGAGLPFVLLAAGAAIQRIDPTLEEAARMSGAGPLRASLGVTLPLIWPALLAGTGLVFLFSASAFGVPYLLGFSATPPTTVLTTRIYSAMLMGGPDNFARAIGLSTVLLGLSIVVLALNGFFGRRGRVRLLAGKGLASRPWALGRLRPFALGFVVLVVLVLVALPLLAVFLTSVQKSFGGGLGADNLTFAHWGEVLANPRTLRAARWSLLLALFAATLVCLLAVAVAVLRRRPGWLGRLTETVAMWPYAIPGTVFAMALIVAFSRDLRFILFERVAFVLTLGDTFWLMLVAYAAKHLALGTRGATEALAQLDPSLEEAARIAGAGPRRAFRDAMLPLLRPALATAFALVFLTSATELTMSVMLLPPGTDLLGTLLFELTTYADPTAAAVLACAFVALVVAGLGVLAIARRPRVAA